MNHKIDDSKEDNKMRLIQKILMKNAESEEEDTKKPKRMFLRKKLKH